MANMNNREKHLRMRFTKKIKRKIPLPLFCFSDKGKINV